MSVVAVAAQPCLRPNRDRGVGFLIADGIVGTAAHTVDGPRRELTVDGRPAEVLRIDVRLDTALLAVDLPGVVAELTDAPVGAATVRTPAGEQAVTVRSTGMLVVTNVSDHTRVEREVHTFSPGVPDGTSGAPLVDAAGRVVGMVQLDRDGSTLADAVTAAELATLLDDDHGGHDGGPGPAVGCDRG